MKRQYRTLLVDPPWRMQMLGSMLHKRHVRPAQLVYPTMTIEEIMAMGEQVNRLAAEGCHLWLWTVNQLLRPAFDVLDAWGFKYHNIITWRKPSGAGAYFITLTQHILFGYKGKCKFNAARYVPNAYDWPLSAEEAAALQPQAAGLLPIDLEHRWPFPRTHSRKPAGSYQLIESVSDGPRLELFARPATPLFHTLPGWHVWGNEVASDVDLTVGAGNGQR